MVGQVLLDAGASFAEKDRDGFCSLLYAVTNQNKVAARLILQSGADVNTTSSRGTHYAHLSSFFALFSFFWLRGTGRGRWFQAGRA